MFRANAKIKKNKLISVVTGWYGLVCTTLTPLYAVLLLLMTDLSNQSKLRGRWYLNIISEIRTRKLIMVMNNKT